MRSIPMLSWLRGKQQAWQARIATLEQQHAALEAQLQYAQKRLRAYAQVLQEYELGEAVDPTALLELAAADSDGAADTPSAHGQTPTVAMLARSTLTFPIPDPAPPGSIPDYLPELRDLPPAQRLEALARLNHGHLFRRDVIRVWRATFPDRSPDVLYRVVHHDPRWHVLGRGHYFFAAFAEDPEEASS